MNETPDGQDGPLVVVKGAPEAVLSMCSSEMDEGGDVIELDEGEVRRRGEELAAEGLRVIAVATGRGEDLARSVLQDEPGGLTLVGLHGLFDPPRDSAIEAIRRSHQAGIRVVMVTGDHATTAVAIGEQVGIGRPADDAGSDERADRQAVTGQELAELSDDDLRPLLDETNVYARVAPGQKLRIVEGLQAQDHIVAVTGDGVNDAPALESAHIGAAMGSGTDVAKEASDMVITDDDFASVYAAVEEGRTAFRNVRVATFFLLSTGGAVVLVILAALGFDWPLPLLPAQILWCNVTPLDATAWLVAIAVASTAIVINELHKRLRPRPVAVA